VSEGLVGSGQESESEFRVPSNVEAEAALIGAMLIENKLVEIASDKLKPDDFFEPLHSRIYTTIVDLVSQGKSVSPVTLRPYFEDDDALKQLGGISYIARLTGDQSGLLAADAIIEQLSDLGFRRRVQAGLRVAALACSDLENPIQEVVAHADSVLDVVGDNAIREMSGGEAFADLIRSFDNPVRGVTCGQVPELDRVAGEIRPTDLVILAARPGMGKTATALSYAIGAAKQGHGVLFITLEMSANQLAGRMAAEMCFTHGDNSVHYAAITEGRLSDWQMRRVCEAETRMRQLPLQIVDTGQLSVKRLNVMVKRYVRRFAARGMKLDLVVVDYLQLMRSGIKNVGKYEDVSEVSNRLKGIAKEHNVGVLALAQLSRAVEQRVDKRPMLSDLRDSGSIEQDADSVLFLYREEYYLDAVKPPEMSPKYPEWEANMEMVRGRIEFIAAKRRNGRTGSSVGSFHGAFQAVR
jgi:replicative DNA helicase